VYDERTETICARICLLSAAEKMLGDPPALSRPAVHALYRHGALNGLVLRQCAGVDEKVMDQARVLLTRASSVYEHLNQCIERGYQAMLPQDSQWPQALFALKNTMPLYLFAKGNLSLLSGRKMAVAGSRAITAQTHMTVRRIGEALARAGVTIVTGGAAGVDQTAVCAVLENGGNAVIVPAITDVQLLGDPMISAALEQGRLLLLCETLPDEPFSPAKALTRNHTIYALGDAALVLASRAGEGGSWSGARACIRGQWSLLYALDERGPDYEGNVKLLNQGARPMKCSDHGLMLGEDTIEEFYLQAPGIQTSLF